MKKIKTINKQEPLRVLSRLTLLIFLLFFSILFIPQTASAQIVTLDPVTAGIQAIIKQITAANVAIQAAESKIQVELSALKYVRQGQQLMNQVQNMQQEASGLMSSVNNLEGTVMMPANELQGLKNSLTSEEATMTNIISMENGNPAMQGFLQNYQNTYGDTSLYNSNLPTQNTAMQNQYSTSNTQSGQTAGYAQGILNNSSNQQHLVEQLGSNIGKANSAVSAEQATGQAVVTLTEEVNQLNKLEAEQAKLAAVQAGTAAGQAKTGAEAAQAPTTIITPINNTVSGGSSPFGTYPPVTNFGLK
jgi:conjugal transfer/entry exclusion protein